MSYVLSCGTLSTVDLLSGSTAWTFSGDGLLVVPAGNLLVAYGGTQVTPTATPSPTPKHGHHP